MARKILLADDSVTAQNMGRRILADAGYDVATVNNGSAALKKIAELQPELVVLDVYMPGYSGLEVCQRVKESKETFHIPVLLTVGKLEPFKPDEAKRVKADGFIIKPFEATELLSALAKLEDKIVPVAEPPKSSRATADEEVETVRESKSEKFGDTTSGWKSRLNISSKLKSDSKARPEEKPKSEDKPRREEKKASPAASTAFHSIKREAEPAEPARSPRTGEAEASAALPGDITPDELAAIAAAAAVFGDRPGKAEAEPEAPEFTVESTPIESAEPAAGYGSMDSASSLPVAAEAATGEVETGYSASSEAAIAEEAQPAITSEAAYEPPAAEAAPIPPVSWDEPAAVIETPAIPANISDWEHTEERVPAPVTMAETAEAPASADQESAPLAQAAATPIPESNPLDDQEVTAALASLGPAFEAETPAVPDELAIAPWAALQTVTVSRETNWGTSSATRWIAEAAVLSAEEAGCVLEEEMQRAHAAMAEASSPQPEMEAVMVATIPVETVSTSEQQPAMVTGSDHAAVVAAQPDPSEIAPYETDAAAAAMHGEAISPAAETPLVIDETDDVSIMSPPVAEQPAELQALETAEIAMMQTAGESELTPSDLPSEAPFEPCSEPKTMAAAAAGDGSAEFAQAVAAPVPAAESARAPADEQRESELAAAWEHWKQIRETVVSPQFTSQLADTATGFHAIQNEAAVGAEAANAQESAPAEPASASSNTIASIVDSVLSELRPKLVEEIAKRLSAEKKG